MELIECKSRMEYLTKEEGKIIELSKNYGPRKPIAKVHEESNTRIEDAKKQTSKPIFNTIEKKCKSKHGCSRYI